jgi:hypothetical protein
MSRLLQRLLDRKTGAVKRSKQRPRLQVEALEDRTTPIIAILVGSSLDVAAAAIALPPPTAGPQVTLFCDGSVRLASGGAEQVASFTIEDVASLNLAPGQRETSIKIDFDQAVDLTLAGATESAEIKGDAVVKLKIQEDGATAVASVKLIDILSLKLDGAPAEGDLTLHGEVGFIQTTKLDLPDVRFDDAAGLTLDQDGVASSTGGGGAGKVRFADTWDSVLTGPATAMHFQKRAGLSVDDTPVLVNTEKWAITPAAPAAGTTSPASLMLDGTESLTLNFLTASLEYKIQRESVGDVTSLKYDHSIYLNFEQGSATATQEEHLEATGGLTSVTDASDITLTPNDSTDLASDTQDIAANGNNITLTVDDTVDLMAAGFERTFHTPQTETGNEVSIHIDSLLSKPGPGG